MTVRDGDIVIRAVGMASSLGAFIPASAAFRAGLSLPVPVSLCDGTDDTGSPAQIKGHPCPLVHGFEGYGRLALLLKLAIDDLLAGGIGPEELRGVPCFVNVPDMTERPLLLEQLDNAEGDEEIRVDEDDGFLRCFLPLVDADIEVELFQDGHTGAVTAIAAAVDMLNDGQADQCLVAAVDSCVELPSLEWLFLNERLKTPKSPVGLQPGEGAAVFLLERVRGYRRQPHPALARVGVVALRDDEVSFMDDEFVADGRLLAEAIQEVIAKNVTRDDALNVIVADLNGETTRAQEWGTVMSHCASHWPGFAKAKKWLPAESFGDVGGASAAFSIAMGVAALSRGYAKGPEILVTSCSDEGRKAALMLHACAGP